MYKHALGVPLGQRFNRPSKKPKREDSNQRFSSFQSLPAQQNDNQPFSDFQQSRDDLNVSSQAPAAKKAKRSYILVEQLPLQNDGLSSNRKKSQSSSQQGVARVGTVVNKLQRREVVSRQEQAGRQTMQKGYLQKYNYKQRIDRVLSTIKEDTTDEVGASQMRKHTLLYAQPVPSFKIWPQIGLQQRLVGQRLYIQQQQMLLQQKQLRVQALQVQNKVLRERLHQTENEWFLKGQTWQRRQAQLLSQCMAISSQEEAASSIRRQAKERLMAEIASLQARCQQMRQQMSKYKARQQQMFGKLKQEKQNEQFQLNILKSRCEYQQKFIEVFMSMVVKLPVGLEPGWSNKKKIAVGWRAVKHLVRKALKLGIKIPVVISHQDETLN